MNMKHAAVVLALGFLLTSSAQGAFIIEIDTDGADDGVLTYNSLFSFGGDTTSASQSAPSLAYGMTGGDSIFSGNGSVVDTYLYTYSPDSMVDNLAIPAATDLGNGVLATGLVGGGPGLYNVYATWPFTQNVGNVPTNFTIDTAGDKVVIAIDQNDGGAGTGNIWIPLGTINYISGAITITQESTGTAWVSMRAAGVLFEAAIPEPSTFVLLGLGGLLAVCAARRN